ncbi:hypothetical protein HMPREF3291_05085 [Bacillus sp. HMSC76G11]|nr:hypothetical protein HMPREF3291_05085 [Bacillus sp. HMSC76G11]
MPNSIAAYRKSIGLSQVELADKLKISVSYLNKIERGKSVPSLRLAIRIATILKVPVETIFHD